MLVRSNDVRRWRGRESAWAWGTPARALAEVPAGGGVAGEGHVGQVGLLDVSEGLLPVSGEALVELAAGTSAEPVKGGLWVLPEVVVDHHLVFANWNSDGSVFCGCERQIYLPLNPLPIIFYCRSTG